MADPLHRLPPTTEDLQVVISRRNWALLLQDGFCITLLISEQRRTVMSERIDVVGVPSEIKDNEKRVALTPDGVVELLHHGHEVVVQAGAGVGSRFPDDEYAAAGAKIVQTADDVFGAADLIVKVKVKEPVPAEYHR